MIGVSFGGSVATMLSGGVMNEVLDLGLANKGLAVQSMVGLVPAIEYRGDAEWEFSKLDTPLFLVMAEMDDSVLLKPTMALFEKHADTKLQVVVLRDEGHFVSEQKWNIAQRLTLAKLKQDLLGDQAAKASLQQLRKDKAFKEAELYLDRLGD